MRILPYAGFENGESKHGPRLDPATAQGRTSGCTPIANVGLATKRGSSWKLAEGHSFSIPEFHYLNRLSPGPPRGSAGVAEQTHAMKTDGYTSVIYSIAKS